MGEEQAVNRNTVKVDVGNLGGGGRVEWGRGVWRQFEKNGLEAGVWKGVFGGGCLEGGVWRGVFGDK